MVCLQKPVKGLKWISLLDLYQNMDKLEDAHLLIAISRLIHMTDFLPAKNIQDLRFDHFCCIIAEFCQADIQKITSNTLVEDDLGITGDDGDDLLLTLQDEFGILFGDENGSIRKAFGLQDDQYLFHSEGFKTFFSKEENVFPLTVEQLYNVVIKLSE